MYDCITKKNSAEEVYEALVKNPAWLVLIHHRPDGDTIGSASAMVSLGKDLGKDVVWTGEDALPDKYLFLPHAEDYRMYSSLPRDEDVMGRLVIALDISNVSRAISAIEDPKNRPIILNIDHHGDNEMFGSINYVDEKAAAVGEILWEIFSDSSIKISEEIATGLYTAIVTDSGNFTYDNTTHRTLEAASCLVKQGARPQFIQQKVYHNQSLEALKLWGIAFSRTDYIEDNILMTWLKSKDFESTGALRPDTENLVSRILEIKDAEFCVLLVEEDNSVRVSLRSSSTLWSAREVAQKWGGGGHVKAAGCTISATMDDALSEVKQKLGDYVKRNPGVQ